MTPPPAAAAALPLRAGQVIAAGICGLVLTLGLARFAYTPLLPLMHAQAGLNDAAGGVLAAVNYLGYMAGALLAAWIDAPRLRQRLYGGALWLAVASTAAMGWVREPWLWGVLRFAGGLCGAAGLLLGSGLVLNWLMRAGRRPELGLPLIGVGLGIAVSALGVMAFSAAGLGWAGHWVGMACIGAIFLIPAWRWRPPVAAAVAAGPVAPSPSSSFPSPTPAPLPSRRWLAALTAAYFCAGWGFVISATFTVTIVERQPALAGRGPLAWLLVGLAAMPAVFAWDRVARRFGDVAALLAAFAVQTLSVALPAASDSLGAALAGALLYGASFIGIVSLTLALVGRRSPANPGKAMARLTLSYGVAQVAAPALTGAMAQASGSYRGALWLTVAVLAAGIACLMALPAETPADRPA